MQRTAIPATVVGRVAAPDAKGSINLRTETGTRQLIDDAAAILGKTRTKFMIESARRLCNLHRILPLISMIPPPPHF